MQSELWTNLESIEDEEAGYVSVTDAMEVPEAGCLVRVRSLGMNTKRQATHVSESITFVPWVKIGDRRVEDIVVGRKLIAIKKF